MPVGAPSDGENTERFAAKVKTFTKSHPKSQFTGPLAFLNSYSYVMGEDYLTGIGAVTEFNSGVNFWYNYGRTLFNASLGQVSYDPDYANGTARRKPVLRSEYAELYPVRRANN
jgi:hypothetical protein